MEKNDILSLIQHVKLNEVGWYKNGIKSIIKSFFGKSDNAPKKQDELYQHISLSSNFSFNKTDFQSAFDNLITSKELVKVNKGIFCLSKNEFKKYQNTYKRLLYIEEETKNYFLKLVKQAISNFDAQNINTNNLWKDFIDRLIVPTIIKSGAKTYEMITGNSTSEISYENDNYFFKKYSGFEKEFSNIIQTFFKSPQGHVKEYILNLLKTYFFIEATKLPENSIEKIYQLASSQTELKIFIDTNFLLSLLDLHDNPSNEAAKALTELIDEISNRVKIKFYVYRHTISEFQNLIERYQGYLKRNQLLLGHAKTLIERDEISGIPKKYYQKCIEAKNILDIEDYFDPYLNNFTVTLKKHNIELQNEKIDNFLPINNTEINDDIIDQVEYRLKKKGYSKDKKYDKAKQLEIDDIEKDIENKFKHDCILWHAVKKKRPVYIDSIKDVKNWILTLDFHFLSYDRFKTNSMQHKISLCLHPNDLISLLYFWLPRSEKFENAIFENFRLPFAFSEFDENAEKVSISILTALSRYENSSEIEKETVTELLTNKILRNKIKPDQSIEKNAELIKEEIFKKYQQKKVLLEKEQKDNIDLKTKIQSIERNVNELSKSFNSLIEDNLNYAKLKAEEKNTHEKELLKSEKISLQKELDNQNKIRILAESQFETEQKKWFNIFVNKEKLKAKVDNRYPPYNKIEDLKKKIEEIEKEIVAKNIEISENIIFYCENKNEIELGELGFEKIKFYGVDGSAKVFEKTTTNPTAFGLRDKDYLTDNEVIKLKQKYPNYKILHYYCFENILYHPENIAELEIPNYTKREYIEDIIKQANERVYDIMLDLKNIRKGYEELKNTVKAVKPETDAEKIILKALKSNNIEKVLKYFSLKKGKNNYKKDYLNKFNLNPQQLIGTKWFKNQIKKIMEI